MNTCVEDTAAANYAIYTCTEDSSTGAVVLSETTYTDAACTTGASVQSDVTLSSTCAAGVTTTCQDTNTYSTTMSAFGGGLFQTGYADSTDCSTKTDLLAYIGLMGCNMDGILYGSSSISSYFASDCSGTAVITLGYGDIFPSSGTCATVSDDDDGDDDDGDDDDNDGLPVTYDGMTVTATWNADDDDDVCFHVDSVIDYKGVQYTYEELKAGKEPECSVPHSPASRGVVISTSCGKTARVTDTHLMATTKGFQLAYSLKAGDVLFGDYHQEHCTVTSVKKEEATQQYFGLNCVHSEVLTSGLRASTFGDFHTLPSWYMTYVGGLVGSDAASSLGGYIAEWYFQK